MALQAGMGLKRISLTEGALIIQRVSKDPALKCLHTLGLKGGGGRGGEY